MNIFILQCAIDGLLIPQLIGTHVDCCDSRVGIGCCDSRVGICCCNERVGICCCNNTVHGYIRSNWPLEFVHHPVEIWVHCNKDLSSEWDFANY